MSEGANKAQDTKKLYKVRFSEKQARQKSNIWSSGGGCATGLPVFSHPMPRWW